MQYVSTRGTAPRLGFEDVMLAGLARDGGLYVPENWPELSSEDIARLAGLSYAEAASRVLAPFTAGDLNEDELLEICRAAYGGFRHRAVAPLVQTGANDWILELFYGPTFAFKDFALQLLARLMDRALQRRGSRATIIGATSGDTGAAAIEAFRGREAIDIFVLHPRGRVSDVQRLQMTTVSDENVHNIAIEGTFDDCQALVKALFNDHALRDRLSLAAVNSINWARIMAQAVYYFTSAVALGAPHRRVRYVVPSGNFGDIFAGYVAAQMGLPIERLVIATNVNDILARAVRTGRYEPRGVVATSSPSMDIQVSSNFERLIFEAAGRDAGQVCALLEDLDKEGGLTFSENEIAYIRRLFAAHAAPEADVAEAISALVSETGYLADPHTAVGLVAAAQEHASSETPAVTLATAHPAKFPDAVREACGKEPEMPAALAARLGAEEHMHVFDSDYSAVAAFIESRSRAAMEIQQ